jgi:hypothetical protein
MTASRTENALMDPDSQSPGRELAASSRCGGADARGYPAPVPAAIAAGFAEGPASLMCAYDRNASSIQRRSGSPRRPSFVRYSRQRGV